MWTQRRSGRTNQRGEHDHRSPYERDRTRVIHCPSFRRLQRKTQILGTKVGDFHRTRLTHSLEVSSIGISLVRNLKEKLHPTGLSTLLPSDDLISVVCLLHDIGHPPFGHGGEMALNYMMRTHGGFEANAQTLRLLTKVEESYGDYGLDLTRRSLLGILKYPVPWDRVVAPLQPKGVSPEPLRIHDWLPPKAYFMSEAPEVDWILSPLSDSDKTLFQSLKQTPKKNQHGLAACHSFDCSIMDIADDIAYGVHDLEDAIHLKLIHRDQLDVPSFRQLLSDTTLYHHQFLEALFHENPQVRKEVIGELVNYFITAAELQESSEAFENQLLKYQIELMPAAKALLAYLTKTIYDVVIDSPDARVFEHGGQAVILKLFEAISSNPLSLLDLKHRLLFQEAIDESSARRVVCDHIANMTDEVAHQLYQRLFGFTLERFYIS